ncbi:MAG: T9SS type A sorting domain-containing protein [Bacteroidia bacterium]
MNLTYIQLGRRFKICFIILTVFASLQVHSQTLEGIDVSHWQGTIDWQQVHDSGKVFAYARATDGLATTDPNFKTNMKNGLDAGMIMGAYCFGRPNVNAISSAQHFVSVADSFIGDGFLPPVMDIETTEGKTPTEIHKWVQDWIDEVKRLTRINPMIYTGRYFANDNNIDFGSNPLWIAHWSVSSPLLPNAWTDWLFWQYTGSGSVVGISGNVPLNKFNGDSTALDSLIHIDYTANKKELTKANGFRAYPNPFENTIHISSPTLEAYQLRIVDMMGKVCYDESHIGSISIETRFLPKGIYVCEVLTKSKELTRIVVVKN